MCWRDLRDIHDNLKYRETFRHIESKQLGEGDSHSYNLVNDAQIYHIDSKWYLDSYQDHDHSQRKNDMEPEEAHSCTLVGDAQPRHNCCI